MVSDGLRCIQNLKIAAKRPISSQRVTGPKGVYPQSDVGLAILDIDASKVFVNLWVHLALAILVNFDGKKQLKRLSTKI